MSNGTFFHPTNKREVLYVTPIAQSQYPSRYVWKEVVTVDWVEQLLQIANLDYHLKHQAQAKQARQSRVIPDLKDDEFWSRGETTK